MKKVDLVKVLEMIVNEEHEQADRLLHAWLVQKSKAIHEQLLREDEEMEHDEMHDKDEVCEADDEDEMHDDEMDMHDDEMHDDADDSEMDMDHDDADMDSEDDEDNVEHELDMHKEHDAEEDASLEDEISDLASELDDLKAEFEEIMSKHEEQHDIDIDGNGEIGSVDLDADHDEDDMADDDMSMDHGDDEMHEEMEDECDDSMKGYDDLEEAFDLEMVRDAKMMGNNKLAGAGGSFSANEKSPVRLRKGEMLGDASAAHLASKQSANDSMARQPAPEVKKLGMKPRNVDVKRSMVSKEGDKSAMLNSKTGFGAENTMSPISGRKKK